MRNLTMRNLNLHALIRPLGLGIWICGVLVSPLAAEQDGATLRTGESGEIQSDELEVDRIVDQLSDDQYARRQQATKKMWTKRETSRQAVQEAARNPDPEVANRANWILRQWRRGALPETPPEIARLLQQSDGPSVLEELLEIGQFSAVVVAVEESTGTADYELISQRVALAISRRFPVYARRGYVDGTLRDLVRLIDLVADSKEMAVCRIDLMKEIGMEIDVNSLLPKSSERWTPLQQREAEITLQVIFGDMDVAITRASEMNDDALLRVCLMIKGDWQKMAEISSAAAAKSEPGTLEFARLWCYSLIAADRADDEAIRSQAVAAIMKQAKSSGDDEKPAPRERLDAPLLAKDQQGHVALDLQWKCLASNGFVDEAIELLRGSRPDVAATVAIAASRIDIAFDVLGFPPEEVDAKLGAWIDESLQEQATSPTGEPTPKLQRLLVLMNLLIDVGREDAAWRIAQKLATHRGVMDADKVRYSVLLSLLQSRREEWIVKLAVLPGEPSISEDVQRLLVAALGDVDLPTFVMLLTAMEKLMPSVSPNQRLEMTVDLINGVVPVGFDREHDFQRLYDALLADRALSGERGRVPGNRFKWLQSGSPRVLNSQMASFFSRLGQAEIATQIISELALEGEIDAIFTLAEKDLDFGSGEDAQAWFKQVSQIAGTLHGTPTLGSASARFYRQDSSQMNLWGKAMVGQWVLARRQSDEGLSEELRKQTRLVLCSPSTDFRREMLEYLAERGETGLAIEGYRTLLVMTAFGSSESTELYDIARGYASNVREADPNEAAKWFDLAIGGTHETTNFRSIAYITLPVFVRRWAVEGAIREKDTAAVEKHLKRIYQLDPLDIDVAERLLPLMRKNGMNELADNAFDQIWAKGKEYLSQQPFDSTSANNLAWVAAMNKRYLEEAVKVSEQAVYHEPDSAVYRDTLAELLFSVERKEEALLIEKACLLDDPGQWHLHEQIKKYREAIIDSSSLQK